MDERYITSMALSNLRTMMSTTALYHLHLRTWVAKGFHLPRSSPAHISLVLVIVSIAMKDFMTLYARNKIGIWREKGREIEIVVMVVREIGKEDGGTVVATSY